MQNIKQHLRIKQFFATSENVVKTQVWIAVSVYVLVAIIRNSGWRSGLTMSQLVGKFVIDVTVLRLICTDNDDDVTQARVGSQIPIINRHLGRRDIGVAAVVDPGQVLGIAIDRLFLQITDNTMRGPRRDHVKALLSG